jgi:hypothetical protein
MHTCILLLLFHLSPSRSKELGRSHMDLYVVFILWILWWEEYAITIVVSVWCTLIHLVTNTVLETMA